MFDELVAVRKVTVNLKLIIFIPFSCDISVFIYKVIYVNISIIINSLFLV